MKLCKSKKFFFLLDMLILCILIFSICSCYGTIKLDIAKNNDFDRESNLNFYYNRNISDSLIKIWEANLDGGIGFNKIAEYDKYLFYGDLSGKVYLINSENGKIEGKLRNKGEIFSSVVVSYPHIVYLVNSSYEKCEMIYYDFFSSAVFSKKSFRSLIKSESIRHENGIIFALTNGEVYNYDFKGRLLWQTNLNAFIYSYPNFNDKVVVFGDEKGKVYAINLKDGKIEGTFSAGKGIFSGFSIRGDTVYFIADDGFLYAVDLNSISLLWKIDLNIRVRNYLVIAKEKYLIASSLSGDLLKIDLDRQSIEWKLQTAGLFKFTPIVFNNRIMQADLNKKIYIINFDTGEKVQEINLDERVKNINYIENKNLIIIGYDDGKLVCYKAFN